MTCKYTPNDIGRYLFDKMTQEEETAFQFHLSQCEKCRTDLQAIRDLTEGLKEDGIPEEASVSPLTSRNKSFRNYFIAASILLLCCLGIVFYYSSGRHPETRPGLSPDTYLYQDSTGHTNDTLRPVKKKDSQ
ncbi:MAG: anti-sigma factor family protein [Odoribacter splanchnicus]